MQFILHYREEIIFYIQIRVTNIKNGQFHGYNGGHIKNRLAT